MHQSRAKQSIQRLEQVSPPTVVLHVEERVL